MSVYLLLSAGFLCGILLQIGQPLYFSLQFSYFVPVSSPFTKLSCYQVNGLAYIPVSPAVGSTYPVQVIPCLCRYNRRRQSAQVLFSWITRLFLFSAVFQFSALSISFFLPGSCPACSASTCPCPAWHAGLSVTWHFYKVHRFFFFYSSSGNITSLSVTAGSARKQ